VWNGDDRAAMVAYQQYFTEFCITRYLEYAQKSERDYWFLPMSECRTLTTTAWKS
jgi:hypothetical protein